MKNEHRLPLCHPLLCFALCCFFTCGLSGCVPQAPPKVLVEPETGGYEGTAKMAVSQLLDRYEEDRRFWKSDPPVVVLGDAEDRVPFPGCPDGAVDLVLSAITQHGNETMFHPLPEALSPPGKEPDAMQQWLEDEAPPSLRAMERAELLLWGWCDASQNRETSRVDMFMDLRVYALSDDLYGRQMAEIRSPAFPPPESPPKVWIETPFAHDERIFAGDDLRFSARTEDRYDGWISNYAWHFGDPGSAEGADQCTSNTASGKDACHRFSAPGQYTVSLTVIDNERLPGRAELALTVEDFKEPIAEITQPSERDGHYTCKPINFSATAKSAYAHQEVSVSWDFGDQGTTPGPGEGRCCPALQEMTGLTTTHCYDRPGDYLVTLTVKDDNRETQIIKGIEVSGTRVPAAEIATPSEGAEFPYRAAIPFQGSVEIDAARTLKKHRVTLGLRRIASLELSPPRTEAGRSISTISGKMQLLGDETGPLYLRLEASDEAAYGPPKTVRIYVQTEDETERDRVGFTDPVIDYEVVKINRPLTKGGPFWIGRYEVSAKQWTRVNPQKMQDEECALAEAMPATCVSFIQALRYVDRLNGLLNDANSLRWYRLPNEDEWEYACKAGSDLDYGFAKSLTSSMANFRTETQGAKGPSEVRDFEANSAGVASMHGNVMEWVVPRNPDRVTKNIAKGGAWITSKRGLACSKRYFISDSDRYEPYFGLRLVAETYGGHE